MPGDADAADGPSTRSAIGGSGRELTAPGRALLIGRQREIAALDALLATVREEGSAAMLIRGEPGVGKSALLHQLVRSASGFQVVRAVGVEVELDLPYAGLHQLCRPLLGHLGKLPVPQRNTLQVALGLASGESPDRFLVGLAVLTLMSEAAASEPLLCVVDDAQWVDSSTIRALAFVARRVGADSIGLVFASREIIDDLDGVLELQLLGLGAADSRRLLDSVLIGRVDGPVRERLLIETRGNPLAMVELPRSLTPAEAASGALSDSGQSLSDRIERSFRRRVDSLPDDTRRLLLLAAAEPSGDTVLLLRAASRFECDIEAADAAEAAGLLEMQDGLSFRHPLARSAVYQAATQRDRRLAHGALADETDRQIDPDRKAWHRALAASGPDEEIAAELERTAERAKSRGGLGAAGAFLERAAMLTPNAARRAARVLVAAQVMHEAGAMDSIERLLHSVDWSQLDELQTVRAEHLRAEVALFRGDDGRSASAALLASARQLRQMDPASGYAVYLRAFNAAFYLNPEIIHETVDDVDESTLSESDAIAQLILRGRARMAEHGFPHGIELLRTAMFALRDKAKFGEDDLHLLEFAESISRALWDVDTWADLAPRSVQLARDLGALVSLPQLLCAWASWQATVGDLHGAAQACAEAAAICTVTRQSLYGRVSMIDAWRHEPTEALARIAVEESHGGPPFIIERARAIVFNAAGQYEAGLEAAQRANDLHPLGVHGASLSELIEAAARCGQLARASAALDDLVIRTRVAATSWALGIEARSSALVADDAETAERLYREAIDLLARAGTRPDLGRAHLLYGEWLRREGRRLDAREQLRTAHEMFAAIGAPAFAERSRRELAATGEVARKRSEETRTGLTAQEAHIARLASDGQTNAEIGTQLFLSPRTVEWHLRHVYDKLGISSRRELRTMAIELL